MPVKEGVASARTSPDFATIRAGRGMDFNQVCGQQSLPLTPARRQVMGLALGASFPGLSYGTSYRGPIACVGCLCPVFIHRTIASADYHDLYSHAYVEKLIRRTMASRTETVPENFLKHLKETFPGFADESTQHQLGLARMAWIGLTKRNQHAHVKDAMFFHYEELDRIFGQSKFVPLNDRLGFFHRSAGWSQAKKLTRSYTFSWNLTVAINEYLAKSPWESATRLLMSDGKEVGTVPRAVASKDKSGVTTKAWVNAKSLSPVKVQLGALEKLKDELVDACVQWRKSEHTLGARSYPELDSILRCIEMIDKTLVMAATTAAGESYMAHHYQEANSGRLYPIGISLAAAQTVVKDAALTGYWEYDISNCHYAILAQMAAKVGYECLAINSYLKNKEETRDEMAAQAGINRRQAKTCLVALMYGARATTWHENAIPREIADTAAVERLYRSPIFIGLKEDVRKAREAILSGLVTTRKGFIKNAFGKSIPSTVGPEKQLAHLLQGVEAKSLQAVVNSYPDDVVLVQHDGFVSSRRLDAGVLSAAIAEATGYVLELEESCLKADANKYFLSRLTK